MISRNKHVGKPAGKGGGKGAAGAPAAKVYPKERPQFDDDGREDEYYQKWMPSGHLIWGDSYNSRWQWSYQGERMLSRSWPLYGRAGSARLILGAAWQFHTKHGGPPCKWNFDEA